MSRETNALKPLLEDLERLKEGLIGGAVVISFVVISFSQRLLQPIQDLVHPTYEYWGQSDPTRVARCKVSKEEMVARVKGLFAGRIRNRTCPKALNVYCATEAVSDLAPNRH
jgi:hypothetical protein